MKYKILINRGIKSAYEFMRQTGKYFTIVSTSNYIADITNHFKLFEPDVYAVFLDASDNESIASIQSLKDDSSYKSIPVIIIGSAEICDKTIKKYPYLADLYIKLPISADNLALRITRYLDEKHENAAVQQKAEEAETNVKKRILAVDDDRNVLKILKAALSDTYDVTTMANGTLVEKFLDSNDVHMILLDHEMPIETGAEVFRKLKDHPKGKNIPVCFLTGVSERSEIEKIMLLRPHGYLLKPINIEMLMATISNLIL